MKTAKFPMFLLLALAWMPLACQPQVQAGEIDSDPADGMVEGRGSTSTGPLDPGWPQVHPSATDGGGWEQTVGEWFGAGPDGPEAYGLTTIVLPFKLPDLGAVPDPFATATFGVMLNPNTGDNNFTEIDLYGLNRVDPSPTVLTTDWYMGASPDPGATVIQQSFLTPASPQGWDAAPNNFTDATGDANLLSYMNSAYQSGANAGNFIFLRLTYASDTWATAQDNYNINVAEADGAGEFAEDPVISFTTDLLPGDTNNNSLIEFEPDFNPILNNWLETDESFNASMGRPLSREDGDLNVDGLVGLADFREWKNACTQVGCATPDQIAAAASLVIPEPGSLVLIVAGILALGARMRRHN